MIDSEKFYEALSQGKRDEAERLTQAALEAGEPPERILKEGLIAAMERIGVKFKNGEIYIPEVLIAARAMHAGMAILKPALSQSGVAMAAKVLAAVRLAFRSRFRVQELELSGQAASVVRAASNLWAVTVETAAMVARMI